MNCWRISFAVIIRVLLNRNSRDKGNRQRITVSLASPSRKGCEDDRDQLENSQQHYEQETGQQKPRVDEEETQDRHGQGIVNRDANLKIESLARVPGDEGTLVLFEQVENHRHNNPREEASPMAPDSHRSILWWTVDLNIVEFVDVGHIVVR